MEVLCYTRQPKEDLIYGTRMACSMHLAVRDTEKGFQPLHHNEGILYAKAVQNAQDGTLSARSLRAPWLFALEDGGFGVAAIRTGADGEQDAESEGCILFFTSRDLVHYEEMGLCRLQEQGYVAEVRCGYDKETNQYRVCWRDEKSQWTEGTCTIDGEMKLCQNSARKNAVPGIASMPPEEHEMDLIEGVIPGNRIEISEETGSYLLKKLTVPVCVGMALSGTDAVMTTADLKNVTAVASYSDGTKVERGIDWEDTEGDVFRGRVHQASFPAPFAENRADPVCMYRDGKYYFIATNDADGNCTLYMRCSDTLEGIAAAPETLFLDTETYPGIGGLLWAPEFHEIGGKLYVFHAATSGEFFGEECRVRVLRDGGDPLCGEDWSAPVLVVKKDGSPLCEEGMVISLDMTVFSYEGKTYAMWSQRQFLPVDQGAWLYLAQIDEQEPWRLVSDPVCIAMPEYGWENNHTYVVEGPYALERDGQLMVTYAAAAVDATYTVGLLKPVMGSDILDPSNWRKNNYPLMSSNSAEGQYGTGHNSYLTDVDGLVWNFYHMRSNVDGPRSAAARRVHFDIDGEPMLDVTQELDLPEKYRAVEIQKAGPGSSVPVV